MNARDRIAGFSLIEVMIAILILGVALVGLTQGIVTALGSNKDSEVQTAAALLAAGQIELVRADGYLEDGVTESEPVAGLALYRWKQTISSTSIDGLHEVSVAVENAKSGASIYELRTLLFYPPDDSSLTNSNGGKSSSTSKSQRGRSR
jgi:prepilin-type N-terminal cleavage/methylation domain-containing protein